MKSAVLLWFTLTAAALSAAPTEADKATTALREGMPQAAIAPLEEALRKAPAGEKNALGLLLARVQLAAGRPGDALKTLDGPCDRGSREAVFLRAAAFAAQGSLDMAAKLAAPQAAENPEAALLLARIRAEQGDTEAARALLPQPGESPCPPTPMPCVYSSTCNFPPAIPPPPKR